MNKVLVILFSILALSCSKSYDKDNQDLVNFCEKSTESISCAVTASKTLLDESTTEFMKGTDFAENFRSVRAKELKNGKALLDSAKISISNLKGSDSFDDGVSLYSFVEEYYELANEPKGTLIGFSTKANELKSQIKKKITEYKLKYISK